MHAPSVTRLVTSPWRRDWRAARAAADRTSPCGAPEPKARAVSNTLNVAHSLIMPDDETGLRSGELLTCQLADSRSDKLRRPGLLALPAQGLHQGRGVQRRRAGPAHCGRREHKRELPIGFIADEQSGFNPCHANVPQLLDAVSRGVMLQGALPVPFPTISLHESFAFPTSMFLR